MCAEITKGELSLAGTGTISKHVWNAITIYYIEWKINRLKLKTLKKISKKLLQFNIQFV